MTYELDEVRKWMKAIYEELVVIRMHLTPEDEEETKEKKPKG